ncbi:hypothetical protein CPB84DRAFT_1965103 [Gymnopilus junonius]|uniref:Uncharacterized protein n=1 Tax=Gymnopilus junonius TaxID=109634 RepID=A0A9P5TJJ8_GYMJU|nr:hypothetical protein CPB84DRAFT_1965103 [Gymnopilus junonius]
MLHIVRIILYLFLFVTSTVLLALTAYRVHHTKSSDNVDYYTGKVHFWDPIVVELLVTSILAMLASLYFISAIAGRVSQLGNYLVEHIVLFILWVMFLIGAAIQTHDFIHLKHCRGFDKQCRVLETIKGFAWICFSFTFFLVFASLGNMAQRHVGLTGPLHGWEEGGAATYNAGTAAPTTTTGAATGPSMRAPTGAEHVTTGNQGTTTTNA